jgi:hypothetical protein
VHNLHTKGLRFLLSFEFKLQLRANTYQEQLPENYIANRIVQEIIHGIVRQLERRMARLDGPLTWSAPRPQPPQLMTPTLQPQPEPAVDNDASLGISGAYNLINRMSVE